MTKVKELSNWLKDYGNGVTDDESKAHEFTVDEAKLLCKLYPWYEMDEEAHCSPILVDVVAPGIIAGPDMVWVQYNGCWFAAERQALFLGTRKALAATRWREEIA